MPLWRIFAHPDTFSYDQRKDLAAAITKLYAVLPAFYVNVLFIDVKEEQVWVGGQPKANFVRIVIEQIARQLPTPDAVEGRKARDGWMDKINATLKPFIGDRSELDWEVHISETPMDLWLVQGLRAPAPNSDVEKAWKEQNRPVPYEKL